MFLVLFFFCAIFCHQGLFLAPEDNKLDQLIQDQSKLFDEVTILRQISIVQAVQIRALKKSNFKLGLKLNQTLALIQEYHQENDLFSKLKSWWFRALE